MLQALRDFLAGDSFVALMAIGALACVVAVWRLSRSPQSWHLDGETKQLRFHAWPEILLAASGAVALATLTFLIF